MKPISRIAEIISDERFSIRAFEEKCGLSNGSIQTAIKNESNLKDVTLIAILEAFPHYNPIWLLTGDGAKTTEGILEAVMSETMKELEDKFVADEAVLSSRLFLAEERIKKLDDQIRVKDDQIKDYLETMKLLRSQIQEYKKKYEDCEDEDDKSKQHSA